MRDVDIYLPPSYSRTRRRYPVVYMQDAQNLADPARAFAGTWELHQVIDRLAAHNIEAIIVGVPHLGERRIHESQPVFGTRVSAVARVTATSRFSNGP